MQDATRGHGILENFLSNQRAKIAKSLIPESLKRDSILDIGCGSYPKFLLSIDFKKRYGFDPSLPKNFKKIEGIELKRTSFKGKLPYKTGSMNVVTMLAVFEHIEQSELALILSEARRVLKKGGVLIITTPCKWTDKLLRTMAKIGLVSKEEIEEHKGAYNHKEILSYLTKGGFKKRDCKFGYFEIVANNWALAQKS